MKSSKILLNMRVRLQMIDNKHCVIIDNKNSGVILRLNRKNFIYLVNGGVPVLSAKNYGIFK
jgi:hypothetical protein